MCTDERALGNANSSLSLHCTHKVPSIHGGQPVAMMQWNFQGWYMTYHHQGHAEIARFSRFHANYWFVVENSVTKPTHCGSETSTVVVDGVVIGPGYRPSRDVFEGFAFG